MGQCELPLHRHPQGEAEAAVAVVVVVVADIVMVVEAEQEEEYPATATFAISIGVHCVTFICATLRPVYTNVPFFVPTIQIATLGRIFLSTTFVFSINLAQYVLTVSGEQLEVTTGTDECFLSFNILRVKRACCFICILYLSCRIKNKPMNHSCSVFLTISLNL